MNTAKKKFRITILAVATLAGGAAALSSDAAQACFWPQEGTDDYFSCYSDCYGDSPNYHAECVESYWSWPAHCDVWGTSDECRGD